MARPVSSKAAKTEGAKLIMKIREELAPPGKRLASRERTAKALGVSPGSVFNWETGKAPNHLALELLRQLAKGKKGAADQTGRAQRVAVQKLRELRASLLEDVSSLDHVIKVLGG